MDKRLSGTIYDSLDKAIRQISSVVNGFYALKTMLSLSALLFPVGGLGKIRTWTKDGMGGLFLCQASCAGHNDGFFRVYTNVASVSQFSTAVDL